VRLEGEPEGQLVKFGGIDSYAATPTIDYPKDAAVIFLTDVFGLGLVNNKLLADDFAKNGFKTIIPDMFNGDPVPEDAMSGGVGWNREEWFAKHGDFAAVTAIVNTVLDALKAEGITKFAFTGYCYGARIAFNLAYEGQGQAIAIAHPGRLEFPDDFEKYKSISKAPLLINSAEIDRAFPAEIHAKVDELMGDFAPGYKREYFEGCNHGFAVRGDMTDPKVKAGKEGAFKATVFWFLEHLK